jgi:hypothetical protein
VYTQKDPLSIPPEHPVSICHHPDVRPQIRNRHALSLCENSKKKPVKEKSLTGLVMSDSAVKKARQIDWRAFPALDR